jgi:hypothetical protein
MIGAANTLECVNAALDKHDDTIRAEERAKGPLGRVTEALTDLRAAMTAPKITTKTVVRKGGQIVFDCGDNGAAGKVTDEPPGQPNPRRDRRDRLGPATGLVCGVLDAPKKKETSSDD